MHTTKEIAKFLKENDNFILIPHRSPDGDCLGSVSALLLALRSMGKNAKVIRCDGHGVPELLDAILQLFPLDTYVEKPVILMEVMKGDNAKTPIWDTYKEIIAKHDERGAKTVGTIDRFDFYDEAKKAYAIIATSEKAIYANVMLQKGVI